MGKQPISFDIELDIYQKEAKRLIYNTPIVAIVGKAGSGKTSLAINTALDMLFKKNIEKIYITRPTVEAGETSLGYLPGELLEKYMPYLKPIEQALEANYGRNKGGLDKTSKVKKLFDDKKIELLSIQHARGINIENAILIVDEAQNVSIKEAKLLLTRIMPNSKVVFTGDLNQSDIKYVSGLKRLIEISNGTDQIAAIELQSNYRSPIVEYIDQNL